MSLLLATLRHGDTAWSAEGRIQGRSDMPLSEAGRRALQERGLPRICDGMRIVTSPLARCVETAALLGAPHAEREPRLAEMSWGAWEGRRLAELREALGEEMARNEARGWDFRPQGGETPREVLQRLRGWLADVVRVGQPTLAVTHRGVIRALFAAAADWDLRGPPPAKLDWRAVHVFRLDARATPAVERLNVA
ncbi:MAG TPA: histidine phosphatase family protein [Ideonella sp.]|nr:histidine phosphatase family protein [Ideonella sp.]